MRQPDRFVNEDGYRSPSPSNQLPSLYEQLRRHRLDNDSVGSMRPSLRHPDDVALDSDPWPASNAVPPSEPSPSWSEASSSFSDPSPRGTDVESKRKRPRFLGDIDRRIIIERLERGEKQADLAREFGVTRAAICHINKNRDEILTRFDILAKSPQGRQMIENYVQSPHVSALVRELRTVNVSVLLTRLRDNHSPVQVFQSAADRLMSMLIEEALVSFGTKPVGVQDQQGANYDGKEYTKPVVALALADQGQPLLDAFASMEPEAFGGTIAFEQRDHGHVLRHIDLPANPQDANVLLCLTRLDNSHDVLVALQLLAAHGISSSCVCVVCITATEAAISQLTKEHRDVKIVTAAITNSSDSSSDGLAHFESRWHACSTAFPRR